MAKNKVVLVIDDVESLLQFIRGSLAGYPVDIVTAVDGRSGLTLAQELRPDVVLLDLALPVMTGWEVLEAMKDDPATADVPIVVVTAHGDSTAAARARDLGAAGFMPKPFRPTELRRIISRYLAEDDAIAV
ncbi:MAG: response regulator [Acidimicrobiia bacterium]|nr:response regulator [Acidimicrobiia bacterium]MBT8215936.1 response regulator [Acidimicrobiia bacterium]NNF10051.1 response regulator [Acidimicrobiia bacterium]NNL68492.1 response regulator [Acidimicrobiia bacterium]